VDKVEATRVAESILESLRGLPYQELVDRYLDSSDHQDVVGASGAAYQVETQAFWDTGQPGDLRVLVSIDERRVEGIFSAFFRLHPSTG
jgi:hypothetical protein